MRKFCLLTLIVNFIFSASFSQLPSFEKRIIFKVKQNVPYDIDYKSKRFISTGIEAIPEMSHLKNIQSVLRKGQIVSENFADLDLIKNIHFIQLQDNADAGRVISALEATGKFEYVEHDATGTGAGVQKVPDDTYYTNAENYQWYMRNKGVFSGDPNANPVLSADINMQRAWEITTGSSSTIVSILDTGLKLDHPEFSGRLWINPGEIAGNGIDDDGNGYVDDVNGYDWANSDNNPTDDYGHGTNVTGILAATGDNGTGMAGVNWNCRIMTGKILNASNFGYYSWWENAIIYSVLKGAKVINMSVGGTSKSQSLRDACEFAKNNNAIIVACMQNQNSNVVNYPAGYGSTIAVGATSCNDRRTVPFSWSTTSGSNFGPHIDLVAPGSYILGPSYTSNTNYTYWSGTSQATPLVAGTVSLMFALDSSLTFFQVRHKLMNTADDQVGDPAEDVPGVDDYYGAGRLNAYKALSAALLPLQIISFSANKKDNFIQLAWITQNEENTSHFDVEKSTNGISFTAIGNVTAENTFGTHNYGFKDLHPVEKVNYYRLKQFDKDGKYVYSRTVAVNFQRDGKSMVVSPNPAKDIITINLSSVSGNIQLELFDALGKLVMKKECKGDAAINASVGHLPAGIYWIKVISGDMEYRQQVMKVK